MSFLVPKKPQILYAPMLSSFGGGSSRGFNPGGSGVVFDYDFVSSTFTSNDTTGRSSASDSVYRSNVSGSSIPTDKLSISSGILTWTPPAATQYIITVQGAAGMKSSSQSGTRAGQGALMQGTFTLSRTTPIKMLIGQRGGQGYGGSGGGGTFVTFSDNTALIVAGGGGGSTYDNSVAIYSGYSINAKTAANGSGTGTGGGTGDGGETYLDSGGSGGCGGGGGGLVNNGEAGTSGGAVAKSFTNGGVGGQTQGGLSGAPSQGLVDGGFGGGSGGGNTGPGGGGYQGGDGTEYGAGTPAYAAGNGGSSYNNGTSQTNGLSTDSSGKGLITITVVT